MKRDWHQIKQIIDQKKSFVLTTHINPDGDGLGCEIALAEHLRSLGKEVTILNRSPMANNYRFLDPYNEIIVFDSNENQHLLEAAEAYFILDISDWGRMKEIGNYLQSTNKPKICIDHHHCPYKFTDIDVIDSKASSTGELVFDLLVYLGAKITKRIAEAIYTCILTDTGSFRFSNTTPEAHKIAAQLVDAGVCSRSIYQSVYEQNSPEKVKLFGFVLSKLKFECRGGLAWFNVTQELLTKTNAHSWDTEGFADYPRSIRGVEVSLMFTELEENRTKVSFRSKGNIPLNSVAMKLGGGGHEFAAGALLEYPLKTANQIVLEEVRRLFE